MKRRESMWEEELDPVVCLKGEVRKAKEET